MEKIMDNERITLWLDEGIPTVRGGANGRGRARDERREQPVSERGEE